MRPLAANLARFAAAILAVALTTTPARAQAEQWWRDVQALAHDSMRGRQTGSPEHRKAAEYIASVFQRAGLRPGGTNGYFQPVPLLERTVDESKSSLALVRNGRVEPLVLGEDAHFTLRAPLAPAVEAPVVFAGYGLSLPEYGHDDLAGLDLRGKVVAYVTGTPKGIPGPVLSHSRNQAWVTFRKAGAVGMIAFSTPLRGTDSAFVRAQRSRLTPAMVLAEPALNVNDGNQLAITFNSARAQKLFAGAPQPFAAIAALADSGKPLPHFDLPVRIRSTATVVDRPLSSDNVVGIWPGSDPALRHEYVVVSAHLDHSGIGTPVNGDSILNGAMDNASGTALLLEVARQLGAQRATLRRSVVLIAVTAEEKGLLGSRYFAFRPTVPDSAVVANLNTDMFLPHVPLTMIMANGLEESDLAKDAHRVGDLLGVPVITDPEPEENRFVRSDQYSWVLRGIPALSLKVGYRRDSPEHQVIKDFRAQRYHKPSDDTSQPVNLVTVDGFARFYVALVHAVANRDTRPVWDADSYFRRMARGNVAGGR